MKIYLNNNIIMPVICYDYPYDNRSIICKDNKNKIGIYMWINKITGEFYIGSSAQLDSRFRNYLSIAGLKTRTLKSSRKIDKALLIYGYDNFDLYILEYCDPERLIEREQYYMDLLDPKYNIRKFVGSKRYNKNKKN